MPRRYVQLLVSRIDRVWRVSIPGVGCGVAYDFRTALRLAMRA